jgi:hypothetical protein
MSIKMIFASAAALAMVAGTPAFAAKSQNERQHAVASDAAATGGEAKARKICRTFKNTISRMKAERVCLTRAEWKKVEAEQ